MSGDRGVPPGARRRRWGQNFLSDPNLLEAIVRESRLGTDDVVLEIGGGEGGLTERLAAAAATVHVIEIDPRLRASLERLASERAGIRLHWADALRFDLAGLDPPPTALIANLPYAVATPVLMRTIAELPSLGRWVVMVQREIADRLRATPGSRDYGGPSVIAQLACRVEMLRSVDRAVFVPRPRVDSAVIRLERTAAPPGEWVREVVRAAFAHRRKGLARSLELALPGEEGIRGRARAALEALGLDPASRAQQLAPPQFAELAAALRGRDG